MVTKTINQLHFEDLDPIRFEELILAMVYRMRRWDKLDHFGKKGSDDGIDIRAVEKLENDKENVYYFQCKRYQKISNAELRKIIDDYLLKNTFIPQFYILVVSCSLTKKQIEYFESYCGKKGFNAVMIWTSSVIETKLYSEYHDLLFAYFGVNLVSERKSLVGSIRRNIVLKKRMRKDFIKVSAKYSCGFPNTLVSSIIVGERYLDYFTTITEDRLWQLLAKPVFRWRNRSGLSMNAAGAA